MTDRASDISQATALEKGAHADFSRTLIIGNSGSGKSRLAARLASLLPAPTIDLDEIHWMSGRFDAPQEAAAAIEMTRCAAAAESWIIEGVYGWLAREAIPRATTLLWLDLPVEECLANLHLRERRSGEDSFTKLVAWAADYPRRETSSSHMGHRRLFDDFAGRKQRLDSRAAVDRLLVESGATHTATNPPST